MVARSMWGQVARDVLGRVVGSGRGGDRSDGGVGVPDPGPPVGGHPSHATADPRRGELPTEVGRLQIAYAPVRDEDADPGEIVWAWVPFEDDPTLGKDRPLLVIGHVADDVAALAMTSQPHDDRHHHPMGSGPWDRDGRPSWIKLDRLIRLDPDGIRREGAVVDRQRFDAVVAAWQAY